MSAKNKIDILMNECTTERLLEKQKTGLTKTSPDNGVFYPLQSILQEAVYNITEGGDLINSTSSLRGR